MHVKKATAINISVPSYHELKNQYRDKPNTNNLLLHFIDKLEHEIVVEVDEFYSGRETRRCFDILDEWFNDNAVIICRNILYDCYKQEYQNYSDLFDENPYADAEELIYETDDTKKYISGTIRLFGREALTNDDNKLVTSFRYTSTQDAANEEYIIVEKDSEYGWYRKKDMDYFEPQYQEIQSTKKWLRVCKDDYCYIVDYDNTRIKNPFTSFDYFDVLYDYVEIRKNDKYGLATLDGNICIPTLYDKITRCSDWNPSKWDLYFAESIKENKKFCFDYDFNIIMELPLNAKVQSIGHSAYEYTLDNGKTGFFDITGKILFPALYEYCRKYESFYCFGSESNKQIMFMCNNSIMNIRNQKFLECNKNLLVLADLFSINFIDTFTTNLKSSYYSKEKIDSIDIAYCDKDSNLITYGIIIRTNGKQGVIDLNGKEIIPPIYDFVSEYLHTFNSKDEYYYYILNETEDGDRWGLADINGNIIFECEYENEISQNEKGNWIVCKEGYEIEISDGKAINIHPVDAKVNWNF